MANSPGFDPVTHVVFSSTRNQVTDMWVCGKRLMKSREVLTLSVNEVHANAKKWGSRITEAMKAMQKEPAAPDS